MTNLLSYITYLMILRHIVAAYFGDEQRADGLRGLDYARMRVEES